MIFWHESSATEPGGTARDGRAHEPGAANIPAMPVAGAAPLISVSQAGSGQRRGSCDYGADRSALPGPALLWLAPDGGMAGDPRPSRQPQAGAAPDAAAGTGSDLPAPEYEQAGSGTQDLSVSAARAHVERVNQVWCSDITYIPMAKGFLYLVAIMDWVSRAVLAWRLSNTLDADFCVEALEEALSRYGRPEIFNTDRGSQFTSDDFTGTLKRHGVTISMDGKGRCMDNIFVERLWRSLKYEEVYLNAYATVAEAKAGIGCWLDFYNTERQHQSLGYRTPRKIYQQGLWICGRSALPNGCASPASRAGSEGGEMLTFAHIPTGTTVNKAIHIDASKARGVALATAPTMIGADIETGRATP